VLAFIIFGGTVVAEFELVRLGTAVRFLGHFPIISFFFFIMLSFALHMYKRDD